MRVGIGYDVHRLEEGLPLVLGGVLIPFHYGLSGHSAGDALLHAIIDALLGASGENDIGHHFPSSDPRYKGVSSVQLLQTVTTEIIPLWKVLNLDATILAQEPRMSPFIPTMRQIIASNLSIEESRVNIKATTTDGLDSFGLGQGIGAQAIALLEEH